MASIHNGYPPQGTEMSETKNPINGNLSVTPYKAMMTRNASLIRNFLYVYKEYPQFLEKIVLPLPNQQCNQDSDWDTLKWQINSSSEEYNLDGYREDQKIFSLPIQGLKVPIALALLHTYFKYSNQNIQCFPITNNDGELKGIQGTDPNTATVVDAWFDPQNINDLIQVTNIDGTPNQSKVNEIIKNSQENNKAKMRSLNTIYAERSSAPRDLSSQYHPNNNTNVLPPDLEPDDCAQNHIPNGARQTQPTYQKQHTMHRGGTAVNKYLGKNTKNNVISI